MPGQTILIIDYEPRSIKALRESLERHGYSVHVAQDGLSGVDAFKRLQPDLTLIEAMIPKKNGFEVCLELKQTPHGKQHPVLLVSSVYKGRRYRTEAFHKYNCDEFLEKPIVEDKLLTTVRTLLREPAPAPAAAAPAPARPPATTTPTPAPTPAPATTTSAPALRDETEIEIIERLDQLLPGARKAEPSARSEENVLSFDPDRPRRRRPAAGPAPAAVGGGMRGGSAAALANPVDEPAAMVRDEVEDAPVPAPVAASGQGPGAFIALAVGAVIVLGVLVAWLLLAAH